MPWDTTHRLTIPISRLDTLKAHNPRTQFILDLMRQFFSSYGLRHNRQFEFNDPTAMWLPIFAAKQFEQIRIEVVESSRNFGALRESKTAPAVMFHSCRDEDVDPIIDGILERLELL